VTEAGHWAGRDPGGTCGESECVGPFRERDRAEVGEAEGVTTVIRARVCGALWAGTAGRPVEAIPFGQVP
jgi:hypothetical protein